ncbi:MAG: HAD-IA family hydrolase [Gammaproteobacteria bacterium]
MTATKAILFDLDGTLLDTAPDLANALNHVLKKNGQPSLPFETIRSVVSHGGKALIKLGFDLPEQSDKAEQLRQQLLDHYQTNICVETRLFPGMESVLDTLESQHIPWGIVTNKPGWLTNPLTEKLQLTERAGCIISGDTCKHPKPHPASLLHAAEQIKTRPGQCLYIGDALRDIEAGKNAGMQTMAARFGYLSETDSIEAWQADFIINRPEDILEYLM